MKRCTRSLVFLLATVLLAILSPAASLAAFAPGHSPGQSSPLSAPLPWCRPDGILVKPKPGTDMAKMAKLHASHGAKAKRVFKNIGNLQVVQIPIGTDITKIIAEYRKSGLVEYAEPDYARYALETPNDPSFGLLWGLHNTGQNGGTLDADIDGPEGWNTIHDATNVIVAVVDSGVRYNHEDLAANMWVNTAETPNNWIDDDLNGYVDDVYGINPAAPLCPDPLYGCNINETDPLDDFGHGTHCAGIIGAVGNNGIGITGVAWNIKIMALKFISYEGIGYDSDAITCIDYARRMGARVISASWGGAGYSQSLKDAIAAAGDAGIVFVAAAGNGGADGIGDDNDATPHYPSSYNLDNIIAVAATDNTDTLTGWSNYGATSVDLAAPGVGIYSTYYDFVANLEGYQYLDGTSMATPHVSGVVGLLAARYPSEDYRGLIARVLDTTEAKPSLSGRCTTGGRLNLQRALTMGVGDLYAAPSQGMSFGGNTGGPFVPGTQDFTLTNYGTASINWTASHVESWLTLSATSGTLLPGASTTVSVSINANANSLANGTYSDTVTFVNGAESVVRSVKLMVGAVYVKPTGSDSNNGSSWATAKQTIQAGINVASPGQDVWVAAGVYTGCIRLKKGVGLYGGFTGTETSRSQRSWASNVTVIDGGNLGCAVTVPDGSTELTTIDGFTIRNGETASNGGAIACEFSSPTIANNTITRNKSEAGGGIYCYGASPVIRNNVITANYGGGVYCFNHSNPLIYNNTITSNTAAIFAPSAGWTLGGGGITCYSYASPTVVNNIIALNSSGVYVEQSTGCSPTFRNNDVFGNTVSAYAGITDPTGTNGNIATDPKFAAGEYANLHIQGDSPCRNTGDNTVVPAGVLDMDCQARIQNSTVDIGADESDGTVWAITPTIIRVKTDGNDANDGSTWTLAKRTVQAAIDAAAVNGGEVWVKAGTYNERITLKPYTYVYGGFAGTETSRSQRNYAANVTTLNGQAAGSVVTVASIHMLGAIDGFTITNGSAYYGGGVYCYYQSAMIANNIISGNAASSQGGGIYCWYCSPVITNNKIKQNTASYYGGGIYLTSAPAIVTNNLIYSNTAQNSGGGIYCVADDAMITNNTIVSNTGTSQAGGIYCGNLARLVIANNIVAFNSSGIYKYSSAAPTLRNNDVYSNTGYNYSGLTAGTGDISVDPKFVSKTVPDYHLTSRSGCIDKGWNSAPALPSVDMDGQARIYNVTVDIGADEYMP